MKHTIFSLTAATVTACVLIGAGHTALGQASEQTITTMPTSVQTTTTTAGTISEFNPQTIIVKTDNAAEPVRYTYSKTTTYVDEDGNPVSMETVKSGLPVTVYYVKDGENLVASKVIVRKRVIVPATNVQESKSTTTTTTTDRINPTKMTKFIMMLASVSGILVLGACTTVKDREPAQHTSSTTTESTSMQQPAPTTTETQTVRSY